MSDKRDFHAEFQAEYAVALAQAVDAAAQELQAKEALKIFTASYVKANRAAVGVEPAKSDALASPDYARLSDEVVFARKGKAAAESRVKLLEMRWETWRTRSSDRRAELRRQEHAQAQGQG